MSDRHFESFFSETRSLVMRANTLRPAFALTEEREGTDALSGVASAERIVREEAIV